MTDLKEELTEKLFSEKRTMIEFEFQEKSKTAMEDFVGSGNLYSGARVAKSLDMWSEKITKLGELKLSIDIEVYYRDKSVMSQKDADFLYERVSAVVNRQGEAWKRKAEEDTECWPGSGAPSYTLEQVEEGISGMLSHFRTKIDIMRKRNILSRPFAIKKFFSNRWVFAIVSTVVAGLVLMFIMRLFLKLLPCSAQ